MIWWAAAFVMGAAAITLFVIGERARQRTIRRRRAARIAALERELGFTYPTPEDDFVFGPGVAIPVEHWPPDSWMQEWLDSTPGDHCPRDESCVIAHPCRVCGADTGEACRPDPLDDPAVQRALQTGDVSELLSVR